MRWLLALALLGCGGNVVLVFNGGVPVTNASCTDVTIVGDMQVQPKGAPDCVHAGGVAIPERAAIAFWQLSTPAWAGPVAAPEANVEMEWTGALASGSRDKGLESGSRDTGLASGSRDKALVSGSRDKGLESGSRDKGLESGVRDKGLESGVRDKGLESGARDQGLESGTRDQGLETGARSTVPLALAKRGSGRASKDKAARFTLTVTNVSDVTLSRVAVVDRVDHQLRVVADAGATTALPDSSTLVVFRSNEALAPHASYSFTMDVYAR
jgi:uncharacterized repeat protein (TIGR01451 family)